MLTPDEILDLIAGAEADRLVSKHVGWRVYRPTQSLETAFRLEEEALNSGMAAAYIGHLKSIVQAEGDPGLPKDWYLAHASPLQRCKAFLMTNI